MNDQRGVAAALSNLSATDRRRGRYEPPRSAMREALEIYTELGIIEGQLDAIEGLAQLDVLDGDPAGGLGLLVLADREQAESAARAALDRPAVAEVYRVFGKRTLTETVEQLLRGAGEGNGRPRRPPG
ncbi:hypothetical protein ACQP2E_16420 [Actinoplanes sp. CA-015351]|uniref:hypothetical protein n=1 Tax=Actinoplanes sp. CA-015351 TaxID=3239897 RepID=UPI003D99D8C3